MSRIVDSVAQFVSDVADFGRISAELDYRHLRCPEAVDAIYKHANSAGMDAAYNQWGFMRMNMHRAPFIAINGLDGEEATKAGVNGATAYEAQLIRVGASSDRIVRTAPGYHTRSETNAMVALAKERGLKNVIVETVTYHNVRSLSCFIGSMAEMDYDFNIHYLPLNDFNPHQPMLGSQGREMTTLRQEIGTDILKLIEVYWMMGRLNGGNEWKKSYGAPPEVIFPWLDAHQ